VMRSVDIRLAHPSGCGWTDDWSSEHGVRPCGDASASRNVHRAAWKLSSSPVAAGRPAESDVAILRDLVALASAHPSLTQFRSQVGAHQYLRAYELVRRHVLAGAEILDWGRRQRSLLVFPRPLGLPGDRLLALPGPVSGVARRRRVHRARHGPSATA
jgi:hypothetical protein